MNYSKKTWETELNRLYQVKYSNKDFKPEIAGHLDEKLAEYKEVFDSELTQTEVLGVLNKMIDNDAIVVGASGSLPGDMQRMWINKKPNTYHMEYGYSCMGYEISGALGVKLAEPEKEVYAMVGDGSFMMLHSELITSIQEDMKINVVLFDNSGFGCINNLQMSNGMGSFGTEFRKTNKANGAIMTTDFAKIAEGYGAAAYSVRTLEELKFAIGDAKKQNVSTLIDIKVLPKTMTDGYDSWWNVGIAEVAKKESIQVAFKNKMKQLKVARKY